MDMKALSPAEITALWVDNGVKKANLSTGKAIWLAIFAGVFIGFGGAAFLLVMGTVSIPGISKLIGASLFPVGLMLVCCCGAELFTGNSLLAIALLDKKITFGQLMRNWVLVYIGNIIGSYLLAFMLYQSGLFDTISETVINVAKAKVSMTFVQALMRSILCNMLVVLAVWFQSASKDITGKIFAIWFPIMLFVFCGYEHSVANMFFIPLGQLLGADVSTGAMWLNNLLPVTIGNVIGGAVIIASSYYFIYLKKASK